MKSVMICNMVIHTAFAVCVTAAAIYFGKASILWWYVLYPFIGYSYKVKPTTEGASNEQREAD